MADAEYREEIARLREAIRRLADQDATLSVQGGNVIVTMDATLTDAEREAVALAVGFAASLELATAAREAVEAAAAAYADDHGERFAATLRGLLARQNPPATDRP